MAFKLLLFNPSNYWRGGYVTTPWQPIFRKTKIAPEKLIVRDSSNTPLRAQVDRIDPADPTRDTLIFSLARAICPGADDYSAYSDFVTVEAEEPPDAAEAASDLRVDILDDQGTGVKLINSRLNVWFNLTPSLEADNASWYAGAATSVQLDCKENLDAYRAIYSSPEFGHDPEKRCMQLDYIELSYPSWNARLHQRIDLFNQRYSVIAKSVGPVRASVTVASAPFNHDYLDLFENKKRRLRCRLYRVISLYDHADYLMEELSVRGTWERPGHGAQATDLYFIARYFSYMDLGLEPHLFQHAHVPDWFAVGCDWAPYQGYGFATDVHASAVALPHPDFPTGDKDKSFSWAVAPSKRATCLHLFKRCESDGLETSTGQAWYELIYKPLRARISI